MIRLDVQSYCDKCFDFEPDVIRPGRVLIGDSAVEQTDTIVRCKHARRCEVIKRYLENQMKGRAEE